MKMVFIDKEHIVSIDGISMKNKDTVHILKKVIDNLEKNKDEK